MAVIVYRLATVADVDAVLAFWEKAAEATDRPIDTAAAVHRLLARDPEALLLAVDGPEVVGTVVSGWDGWRGHLYRLAVLPQHRRRGIAATLVRSAEQRLGALGVGRSDAMVLDDNAPAHDSWSAWGYTRQTAWSRWVRPL